MCAYEYLNVRLNPTTKKNSLKTKKNIIPFGAIEFETKPEEEEEEEEGKGIENVFSVCEEGGGGGKGKGKLDTFDPAPKFTLIPRILSPT